MTSAPTLILASSSPRVATLLRDAGFDFEVLPAPLETEMDVEETPDGYVRRLAISAVALVSEHAGNRPILAAASIVTLDGQLLTTPASAAAAKLRLERLAGREHVVTTAVCLSYVSDDARRQLTNVERTAVSMAPMTSEEIDWYVGSGEAHGAAGGYLIDKLGSRFITRLAGSHSNAAGLPVATVQQLWTKAGLPLP